jgi:hypothetical protein
MTTTQLAVKITFTEPTLGTSSNNPEIVEDFQTSKAPTLEAAREELDSIDVQEQIEKAKTVFARDDQRRVHCWDYQWKGFFKERILAQIELGDITHLSPWTFRHAVDQFVHISPRRILFRDAGGQFYTSELETLQRPIRVTTMKGDRVALAASEMLPLGTTCEFTVTLIQGSRAGKSKTKEAGFTAEQIKACLDFGKLVGFSQWRTGGYGRFVYTFAELEGI